MKRWPALLGALGAVMFCFGLLRVLMAFFQVSYVGKTYDDPANLVEVSARTVLAAGVGADLFESRLGLSFRVDDLLDVRGQDLLGYPLPGRRYTGRLSYRHVW